MDYSQTLNLPKTDFPMKASLPEREPATLKFWNDIQLYKKLSTRSADRKFIFHDGPPYANGNIHIGTALNKILKDLVVKYKTLRGFSVPYTPGWDTHGLPIELKVMETLKGETDALKIRKSCKEYASRFQKIQCEEFKRLGTLADYDNPYLTFLPEYEARELEVFEKLVSRDFVRRRLKPIYWCPKCVTALAEAEIEYEDHKSPSIYVAFQFVNPPAGLPSESFIVIWTTTPWTLPGNTGVCLNEEFEYTAFEYENRVFIVASELQTSFLKAVSFSPEKVKTIRKFSGKEFSGCRLRHPFIDRESLIVFGEHVTLESGTGCVHTAPGHGTEDYITGLKYGLDVISPVDEKGCFDSGFEQLKGVFIEKANPLILDILKQNGSLLGTSEISHSYPHCWRCKKPVIFRATPQWFIRVEESGLRHKSVEACGKVNWYPKTGYQRITSMLENRPDWCISRQRVWGVPIPALYCEDCNEAILDLKVIRMVIEKVRTHGSDCWWKDDISSFIPDSFTCPSCSGKRFRREKDILDVWFDSGTSHWAVLNSWPGLSWPADLYLEGSDQHRGWFQTSLLTSAAAFDNPPYSTVLTHGFVVDGEGRKMSKSVGNTIAPSEIISKYGADILRLWVASSDYQEDIRISSQILNQMADSYRKIRNTARFLLANLFDSRTGTDFSIRENSVSFSEMEELDQYILSRLGELVSDVTAFYEKYEFYRILHRINNFCTLDLSAFYLDIVKDRLYTSATDSQKRRSCQTAMHQILKTLTVLISPVLSFTAEEIWKHIPGDKEESVFLASWPEPVWQISPDVSQKYELLSRIKEICGKALENSRTGKVIGHSLDACVTIWSDKNYSELSGKEELLREIMIVSEIIIMKGCPENGENIFQDESKEFSFMISRASGEKCPRCWQYRSFTGEICDRCSAEIR